MKLLIDTNIILDALTAREPWAKPAQAIMLAVAEEKCEGCTTATSFTDICYVLRKHLKDKERIKQVLLGLMAVINVLDVNSTDCAKAFELPLSDYEDALLVSCAKRHKIEQIVTRGAKLLADSPIKAVYPDELLDQLHE